jgi:hypothetical protein
MYSKSIFLYMSLFREPEWSGGRPCQLFYIISIHAPITSNRDFSEWDDVFNNDLLSSAALDRLTHHAHAITITGNSYRQLSRRKEALQQNKELTK